LAGQPATGTAVYAIVRAHRRNAISAGYREIYTMKSKITFLLGLAVAVSRGVAQTATSTQTVQPAPHLPNFAPPPVSFAPSTATPTPAPRSTSATAGASTAATGQTMATGSAAIVAAPINRVIVSRPPPPDPAATIMPSAVPNQTWVPGHYVWRNNDWVWINGAWSTPPQMGAVWISGSYDPETRMWIEGHWSTTAATGTTSTTANPANPQ
jgi:hypothetical protein